MFSVRYLDMGKIFSILKKYPNVHGNDRLKMPLTSYQRWRNVFPALIWYGLCFLKMISSGLILFLHPRKFPRTSSLINFFTRKIVTIDSCTLSA